MMTFYLQQVVAKVNATITLAHGFTIMRAEALPNSDELALTINAPFNSKQAQPTLDYWVRVVRTPSPVPMGSLLPVHIVGDYYLCLVPQVQP